MVLHSLWGLVDTGDSVDNCSKISTQRLRSLSCASHCQLSRSLLKALHFTYVRRFSRPCSSCFTLSTRCLMLLRNLKSQAVSQNLDNGTFGECLHVSQVCLIWVETRKANLMSNEVHDESVVCVLLWLGDWEGFVVLLDVWFAQGIPWVAERRKLN